MSLAEGPDAPLWPRPLPPRAVDLLGIGQSSLDHVCAVGRLPAFGGKRELDSYAVRPGGQVATALLAAARLGLRAAFVGTLGDDRAAEIVLGSLRAAGVDVSGAIAIAGAPTRLAVILVERGTGERMVLWHRDPRLALRPEGLDRARIEGARILHLDASDPDASVWAAGVAREAGVPVLLDADAPWDGWERLLARVDFPIVSREFAEEVSGTGRVGDGLKAVSSFGARLAVVTVDVGGAVAVTAAGPLGSPSFEVEVRDTTGAGDAFHGAFAWALAERRTVREALRLANAAAGHNCGAFGAQGGLPTREELERFLAAHRQRSWQDPDEGRAPGPGGQTR